jgi:cyclopropane-fatty-acyl-phospholipid synthase
MEDIKQLVKSKTEKSLYRKMVLSILKGFKVGKLTLSLPEGEVLQIGTQPGIEVDLKIKDEAFFKKTALYGDIGFGESYMDGDWTTSDLTALVRWVIGNIETSGVMSGSKAKNIGFNLLETFNKVGHFFNRNTRTGSAKNISYHYDLSNDFYQMMLDKTMNYSCAMFENNSETLYDAQVRKLQSLCDDLDIQPGDHILEIGCGWGGFAEYAASKYDCKITGVTISKEQYDFAVNRIQEAGLQDRVSLHMMDYREIEGKFDKIVSIEMIEAVGHDFLPEYFETIHKKLKDTGVAVIQAITSPDSRYDEFRKGVDFIQKHIFPGSLLPSVNAMVNACKETTLQLHNLRDIGLNYAKTLRMWKEEVDSQKEEIRKLGMDDIFFRKWDYYLCYCEAAFMERNISTVQVTFIKPNNTTYKKHL